MKKGIFVILSLILLTACDISSKGSWSAEDKAKARSEMKEIDEDLSYLGDYKEEFIDCYLGKAEANYSSFEEADSDIPGCEKIAMECVDEIIASSAANSKKGDWSDRDMNQFMN